MEIFNLLSGDVGIAFYGQTYEIALNWIGKLIRTLLSLGSVGVGIILFSVILRFLVLPFDVYQRITMRKQNIKMKDNKEKMEKLQKQYANNKELYNQKIMEMYKENGFSMFSSCLPMILSMVIFIVAINAFNAYAQFANVENYNTMVHAYNKGLMKYCADLKETNVLEIGDTYLVKENEKYIYYVVDKPKDENGNAQTPDDPVAYISTTRADKRSYYIDVVKAYENADIKTIVDEAIAAKKAQNPEVTETEKTELAQKTIKAYFQGKAQDEVIVAYENEVKGRTSFLWIKNVWAVDASYKHPVLEFASFKAEVEREDFDVPGYGKLSFSSIQNFTNVYDSDAYNDITAKLSAQKSQANGYYILILLSIGTILLQQVVTMRSQKEQQQYSSVDGQGASQQKMTMFIMTTMFGIFSFMYSSAFSIYMVTGNILSIVSTFIINKLVDIVQSKKEAQAWQAQYDKRFASKRAESAKNADKKNKK